MNTTESLKKKDKAITTITLKQINKEKVYRYIYQQKQTSKMQIVSDLQMGLSTVSQNLNLLEKEGLISREGYFESTGGRKAQVIQIVPDFKIAIGVGLLKNMVHMVSVNLYGETIMKETMMMEYENTPEYYDRLVGEINRFIDKQQNAKDKIFGVSIATQGIISTDGESVTYGKIMGNTQMRIEDFSSRLDYPCHLEHDSKAAGFLELWNHPMLESAAVFLLNQNFGGAVITNSKVHHGISMRAGIFEHICVDPDGPVCYCGQKGCLETFCSAGALEKNSGLDIGEFFHQLRDNTSKLRSDKLETIWDDYLCHLAYAIRIVSLVLDCPIIISGSIAPYFQDEDVKKLLGKINSELIFPMKKEQLIFGTHGQYTQAIGVALYYIKKFLK